MQEYDYVIVGAGSAGCVLADRLTADGGLSVLLLEAGGMDRDPLIHIPLGMGRLHETRRHDWGYDSEPEPGLGGRVVDAMRGKVLGGSSAINHMAHVRGNRGDYDRWAALYGLADWSYAHALPYFKRSESWEKGPDDYRGGDGPLKVTFARAPDPLFDGFLKATESHGIPYNEDYNGARQEGISRGQSTIYRGRRQSGATAYLHPALKRKALTLRTGAHATRVLMEGNRAIGVEYLQGGQPRKAYASREVILSGGAFNTPQLLMLSGIGPAADLRALGIATVIDAPGVGGNLQDHIGTTVSGTRPVAGPFRREMRFDRMAVNMLRAHFLGTGPATMLPGGLYGFIKTDSRLTAPDFQFVFRGVNSKPHLWFPGIRKPYADRCGIRPMLLHPKSRGRVRLRSADPMAPVQIFQNFFQDDDDIRALRSGIRFAREIMADKALDGFRGRETAPGSDAQSDADIDRWIRKTVVTAHHPLGTCAMGADSSAVLTPDLRVRGAEGLRVVDASAMPDLTSGNINACVVMIAEKASDIILGRPALPPSAA
ncbi:MAG: GMC family oxidoreductase [Alphaproteobacteria bacterium]